MLRFWKLIVIREKKVVQVSEEFIFRAWSNIHLSGNVIKFSFKYIRNMYMHKNCTIFFLKIN
jgi:hypothetical protein